MTSTWSSVEILGPGIYLYKDVLPKEMNIINRIEKILSGDKFSQFHWSTAQVGYNDVFPEYRDCVDFKFKKKNIKSDTSPGSVMLQQIWQDVYDRQSPAVTDYCNIFNIGELKYWEAFNFVRYSVGHHFQEHADHGYSYNCTVSLVNYINDDYEGGEIVFPKWDVSLKPSSGDLVVFPSNYMWSHIAMPVTKGVKYSIVTMLDYSEKFHTPEMYHDTGN